MTASPNDSVQLSELLEGLTNHIDKLSARVFDLEDVIGNLIGRSECYSSLNIESAQSLDFLRQSLDDCAVLVLCVSKYYAEGSVAAIPKDHLLKRVKLDSTKSIIALSEADVRSPLTKTGNVELF